MEFWRCVADKYCLNCRVVEYAVDTQNLNLSAIRTIRVLRPLRAINRIPSECIAQIPRGSSRHVLTRHDTLSSASWRACRAVLSDKLDTTKMHGLDTSNVSCRVETWRDEPSGIWAYCRYVYLSERSFVLGVQWRRWTWNHSAILEVDLVWTNSKLKCGNLILIQTAYFDWCTVPQKSLRACVKFTVLHCSNIIYLQRCGGNSLHKMTWLSPYLW